MGILTSLLVGAIAGWLAGIIMGKKHKLLVNIILGVVGGAVGGWLLSLFNISANGFLGNILVGVLGACILVFLARRIS